MARWAYDPRNGRGRLASRSYGGTAFTETYAYNMDARLSTKTTRTRIDGTSRTWTHRYGYDAQGRPETVAYPSGLTVEYVYNRRGYLSEVLDRANAKALVAYDAMDAYGNVTREVYGNGVRTVRDFDAASGRPTAIDTALGRKTLQANRYAWRSDGLLEGRRAGAAGSGRLQRGQRVETFGYDYLDRLTSARTYLSGSASPSRTLDFGYDRRGHLTRKTSDVPSDADVTAYRYENGRAGRRRLTEATVGGVRQMFGYDASGHVVRYAAAGDDDRFIAWDARGLPTRVTAGSSARDASPTARDEFRYGPDGDRYYRKSAWRDADGALRTERAHYVGAYEEVARAGDAKYRSVEKTRISDVVLHVRTTSAAGRSSSFEHLHRDHLGSVESATDAAGAELLALGYDPFGERRDRGWTAQLGADDVEALADARDMRATRGYAGHEHLDRTGFVHMNGRLYDPRLGRYLSPDPIVADATDSRNWNLYAYVGNAPTSYVDPTGLFRAGPGCNVGGVMCLDGGGGGGFSTATARLARLHVRMATARIRVYGSIHVPSSRSDMGGGRGGFFAPYARQHIFRVPVFHATAHEVRMPDEGGEPADQPMFSGGELASIGAGAVPVVGSIQSVVEVVTGHDYIAGELVHRGLAAVGSSRASPRVGRRRRRPVRKLSAGLRRGARGF